MSVDLDNPDLAEQVEMCKGIRDFNDQKRALIERLEEDLQAARDELALLRPMHDSAVQERDELRANEALMTLTTMLRLGEPVRPDIHACVVMQRDTAIARAEAAERQRDALLASKGRAVSAGVWYMHDNHTASRLVGTVSDVLEQARKIVIKSPYGMLSSVRLLDSNDNELRSIGTHVHARKEFNEAELEAWRGIVEADSEAVTLLKIPPVEVSNGR